MSSRPRPRTTLLLPESVRPGQIVGGTAEIVLERPLDIEGMQLELWRVCELRTGWLSPCLGQPGVVDRRTLHGPGRLEAGSLRLPFQLALPDDLLPTLKGEVAWRRYECRVTLRLAPAFDLTDCYELRVEPPPGPPEGRRVFAVEPPEGRAGGSPYIELSLTSDLLEPGAQVAGAVAAGGAPSAAPRSLELQLVRHERFRCPHCGTRREKKRTLGASTLTLPGADVTVPFHLALPDELLPSGGEQGWSIEWRLEARLPRVLAPDVVLRAPLTVVQASQRSRADPDELAVAPPSVGDDRQRALWQEAADRTGLQLRGSGLHGAVAGTGVELTVHVDPVGGARSRLIGELTYADLGLDLHVERLGRLGRLFGGGGSVALLQDPVWDGRHQVVVREPAQVAPLGSLLWPVLHSLEVVRFTDEGATLERSYDPYVAHDLIDFIAALQALSAAIEEVRQAIPPPASMATALPVWQALAQDLGGTLCQGRMAIRGQRGGMPALVTTRWSAAGEPLATRLRVIAPRSLERPVLSWEAHTPEPEAVSLLAGSAAQLLRQLHAAGSVRLAQDGVVLEAAAPAFDDAPLLEQLDRMVRLCHLLIPRSGPYR